MRPRALGDDGGDFVTLPAGNDNAVLRGLASERRLRREAGVAGTAGVFMLSALLLPQSLSWSERGAWTRARARDFGRPRPRAGVDVAAAVTVSAIGFARTTLPLSLLLPLLFGPCALMPRAISAMPVSSVPSVRSSSSSPLPSSAGERARLARPLLLAPALALAFASAFAFRSRARMLWQFSSKQETSLSSSCVASARNRARFASVCDVVARK